MAMADGHFRKGRKLIPTFQFRRKLAHEIIYNTIGVDTVDSGRLRRSTCTPDIAPCKLLKVKNHEGTYEKKGKKIQKSQIEISKTEMRQL